MLDSHTTNFEKTPDKGFKSGKSYRTVDGLHPITEK